MTLNLLPPQFPCDFVDESIWLFSEEKNWLGHGLFWKFNE